jgi:hypothetical protein
MLAEIARMWDRLGHDVIAGPAASDIVTVEGGRKWHLSGLPVLSSSECRL